MKTILRNLEQSHERKLHLAKNILYNQNNSLKKKAEIIIIVKPPRKATMHPQVVSISRENAVITQY